MDEQIITLAGTLSKGGLESYDDIKKNSVQKVRGDFLAATFRAKATFAIDGMIFNMACVNLFPKTEYVVVNIDEKHERVIIEPCKFYDRDSLKFANFKDGRNNPRKCTTRIFCELLYGLMKWHKAQKYRVMAIFQEWGDKQVAVFNLDESLPILSQIVESDDGTKKRSTMILMPEEWKGRFGHTLEELEAKRINITDTLVTIDNETGERRVNHNISPKLPTPEELMHRPYGGMRPRKEENDDE